MFRSKQKSQIITTVKRVMPAVVSIAISKNIKELAKEMPEYFKDAPLGRPELSIPPEQINARGQVQVGGGSGFIVDAAGVILTNKHVIAEPGANYTVVLNDNQSYPAEILARDPVNDVAILKIKPKDKLPTVAATPAQQ